MKNNIITQSPTLNRYSFPTEIVSGMGARNEAGPHLAAEQLHKTLIVTDKGIAKLPMLDMIKKHLDAAGLHPTVFSGVHGNPTVSQLEEGVKVFKEVRADSILALGGGAAMDVAKGIALMAHNQGNILDYCGVTMFPITKVPYLAAIPTTAGTGSEVGRAGVISDNKSHKKHIFFDNSLLPKFVVLDPELTVGLPADITAATGMDALTHLVEAFIAQGENPLCDGIALEGVHLLAWALPKAVQFAREKDTSHPDHMRARHLMQNAATMGAIAFQKGLGVTHSLAHSLSTVCDLHHGLANAIMIPYAMEFNRKECEQRFARIALAAERAPTAEGFITWLYELRKEVGIPNKLSEVGVKESHLPNLIKFAMADTCHLENPVIPVRKNNFKKMFEMAL